MRLDLTINYLNIPMKRLLEFENALKESIQVQSISGIAELSCYINYEYLINQYINGNIMFGYKFRPEVMNMFGSDGEKLLFSIQTNAPKIIVLVSILLAVFKYNLLYLLGIPLTTLGLFMAKPSIMKGGYSLAGIALIFSITVGGYYLFRNFNIAFLFFSYGYSNAMSALSQKLNDNVFARAVMCSEIVFIYFYLKGELAIKDIRGNKN